MAAQFWDGTAAMQQQGVNTQVPESDMPVVEWGLAQVGTFPDYTAWLPYDNYSTFVNLGRLTALERLVFIDKEATLVDLIDYVELCSSLYYHLMQSPTVQGRYNTDPTWRFGKETVTCLLVPLTKAIHAMVCAALVYSEQMEAPYEVDTASRKMIHAAMCQVLGYCRFITGTFDAAITDARLIAYIQHDLDAIERLVPFLRAYMFFNLGSITDYLKQQHERAIYSKIRKPTITEELLASLSDSISLYLASLNQLHDLPVTTKLEYGEKNVFLNPHVSLDTFVTDVADITLDTDDLAAASVKRATRVTSRPTSWPQHLVRDLLATRAITYWVVGRIGKAIGLARLSLALGEPIEMSDAWEACHMRVGNTLITTEPDELIVDITHALPIDEHTATRELPDIRPTVCVRGLNVYEFLATDAPVFLFQS